ncbi:MAG: type II toxin-antitoxin system VapC family toxin [Casimicrobiaceae bacterium]|nr:type II toxin-antitoxin system VapC family toxin [Casimicrobiaceae bacterium]MCX8098153.1 type II toxin-antitoxin system VapC family toxin [Casimicrobiaceae bacterium]MDW8312998.1 type II toxin-antitoxin system VapC family toxin [Burkholderiales bacterium]
MRVFLDSSALVKRYIREAGTDEVLAWCDKATELAVAVIAVPEVISAFRRLVRESRICELQYAALKSDLRADLADALLCEVSLQVVQRAIAALEAHPLRAMDALHVGAALVAGAEVFVSADARQCAAATQLGLKVVAL